MTRCDSKDSTLWLYLIWYFLPLSSVSWHLISNRSEVKFDSEFLFISEKMMRHFCSPLSSSHCSCSNEYEWNMWILVRLTLWITTFNHQYLYQQFWITIKYNLTKDSYHSCIIVSIIYIFSYFFYNSIFEYYHKNQIPSRKKE